MKHLRKFQLDIKTNAKITTVQSLENLHIFSHIGEQKNSHKPIFPHNIKENIRTS